MTDASQGSSTFAKGLRVLECFEDGAPGLTMSAIGRMTGFDRATVRRLCLTLRDSGYLAQNGSELRLTPRILAPAGGYLRAQDVGRVIQPVLNAYAQELRGEISMATRDRDRALYVAQSATPGARLSIGFVVGSTVPLLPTSLGRMLLARAPAEDLERVLALYAAERHTPATETDPAALRARIATAAEQGYALVRSEFEAGIAALSVQVGPPEQSVAVIGTSMSEEALQSEAELARVLDILRRTARSLRGAPGAGPR